MFNNLYAGKRVLVTGHTGFKGSWLTLWLLKLGAQVSGFSDATSTLPSMFDVLKLDKRIDHNTGDIRDFAALDEVIERVKPEFIFHLAAQPIVSKSYSHPSDTVTTNVLGTLNVLECLRRAAFQCTAVIITSDKCYENVEWEWGYRETDHLGGKDIYSGSKAAAEILIHSYHQSFFASTTSKVRISSGRAGNVIGGGDWAQDRVVADCMRNWSIGAPVEIRSPNATRPWQHVLEPISGYLALGAQLSQRVDLSGEAFNFGPQAEDVHTVRDLLCDLSKYWNFESPDHAYRVANEIPFGEAGLLKLNCDKALAKLKWHATLRYDECVQFVSQWYYHFYEGGHEMHNLTLKQIEEFELLAHKRNLSWTSNAF